MKTINRDKGYAQVTSHDVRPLYVIAADIRRHWTRPFYGAVPYLNAMARIDKITDPFMADNSADIVARFLLNAARWRRLTAY